jgi:hypothetical protein
MSAKDDTDEDFLDTRSRVTPAAWTASIVLSGGASVIPTRLSSSRRPVSVAAIGDHQVAHQMFVDVVDEPIAVITLPCAGFLPVPRTGRHRSQHSTMKGTEK